MKKEQEKPLIFELGQEELAAMLKEWGEPKYRVKQIWQGLYQNLWGKSEEFSNLPEKLRNKLAENFSFSHLLPVSVIDSKDGKTRKSLLQLPDGQAIEAVLMKYDKRRTLCISTQAGCAMGCTFCATGQMGFGRNLSSGEICEQVLYYARQLKQEGEQVSNVVFMGMGEPFHNYDASMQAIDRLNDKDGLNLGARRFTVSTVGLVAEIRRFAKEKRQVNLAVSLHAVDDELRSSMLPINKKYPVQMLIDACRDYVEQTSRRITFEWALIQGVNDTPEQARKLAQLLDGLLCHVNIIPLNPTEGFAGEKSSKERVKAFQDELVNRGIPCTVRLRRGIEIQAGCGQLASLKTAEREKPG